MNNVCDIIIECSEFDPRISLKMLSKYGYGPNINTFPNWKTFYDYGRQKSDILGNYPMFNLSQKKLLTHRHLNFDQV